MERAPTVMEDFLVISQRLTAIRNAAQDFMNRAAVQAQMERAGQAVLQTPAPTFQGQRIYSVLVPRGRSASSLVNRIRNGRGR